MISLSFVYTSFIVSLFLSIFLICNLTSKIKHTLYIIEISFKKMKNIKLKTYINIIYNNIVSWAFFFFFWLYLISLFQLCI